MTSRFYVCLLLLIGGIVIGGAFLRPPVRGSVVLSNTIPAAARPMQIPDYSGQASRLGAGKIPGAVGSHCEWTSDTAAHATESSRSGTSLWRLGDRDNVRRARRKSAQPLRARYRHREPHDPGRTDNASSWSNRGGRRFTSSSACRYTYGCFSEAGSNAYLAPRTPFGVP